MEAYSLRYLHLILLESKISRLHIQFDFMILKCKMILNFGILEHAVGFRVHQYPSYVDYN